MEMMMFGLQILGLVVLGIRVAFFWPPHWLECVGLGIVILAPFLRFFCLVLLLGTLLLPSLALAATGGGGEFPWDPLLDALVANIGGRTLRVILILAIIGAGIGFYFAHEGTFIRSAFALVIGFSIACAAATWGPTFFGAAAAATGVPVPALHWETWMKLGLVSTTVLRAALLVGLVRLGQSVGRQWGKT